MKHLLFFSFLLAVSSFAAGNLFPNPEFKINPQYKMPYDWQRTGKLTTSELDNPIDDGKTPVLKIIGKGKTCNNLVYLKAMKPGVAYLLSVKIKAEKGKKYEIFVQAAKPKFQTATTGSRLGTGDWQDIVLPVRFDTFETTPYFCLAINGEHTLCVASPCFSEFIQKPIPGNLIKNAQLIKRNATGLPLGFSAATKGVDWKCVITPEESYILVKGGENNTKSRQLVVHTPVKPGVKYTFSAEFNAEEGEFFQVAYQANIKWKTFESKKIEGNDQWQKVSVTFTFPEIKKASYGLLIFYGTEDIKVRNIVLTEVNTKP